MCSRPPVGHRQIPLRKAVFVPLAIEWPRLRENAAVHHDEGLGSSLQHPVGICIREGKKPFFTQDFELGSFLFEALLFKYRQVRKTIFTAELVHEAKIVIERQHLCFIEYPLEKRHVLGERGRRPLQSDAKVSAYRRECHGHRIKWGNRSDQQEGIDLW